MDLSDAREAYDTYSAKASDLVRQLGFAGIAVIWVFSGSSLANGQVSIPDDLLRPGIALVIVLGLDLLQYVAGTVAWSWFARWHERRGTTEVDEIDAPRYINWPTITLFWLKIAGVLTAYGMLLNALVDRLR